MNVSIIGLGLIGGSIAIELRKKKFAKYLIGVDSSNLHAQTALNLGLVDELNSLDDAILKSDLIILAVPADICLILLPKILGKVNQQIITDVCSTKENICTKVLNHNKRKNYVAAHPMAGTEHSGPWAAQEGLFDGKAVILSDTEDSSANAVEIVEKMYDTLNMNPIYMSAQNQDMHAAYVSHISHISSFALALTVLDKEKNEKNIFNLASGGFDSTVRLAKSSAEMWVPIFDQNAANVSLVLSAYIEQLTQFQKAINSHNQVQMTNMINNANRIKKVLKA